MDDMTDPNDRDTAKRKAAVISVRWRERGFVDDDTTETLNEYFKRWAASREEHGLVTVSDDRGRFSKWIAAQLGTLEMGRVVARDLETFVSKLDANVRAGALSWKTAVHVWGC